MKKVTETVQPGTSLYCDEFSSGPAYYGYRPHGGGDWLLIFTRSGAGRIVTKRGAFTTRAGDVFVFAPTDYQDYGTAPEVGHWNLLWAHFLPQPNWAVLLRWPETDNGLKLLHLEDEVRRQFHDAMRRMILLSRRKIPGAHDLAVNAMDAALLWANIAASRELWLGMDPRVRKTMDYLVAHLREPFHLEHLARSIGVSVSRLSHLFKEHTGSSVQQFMERQRLQHAAQLLRLTNLKISEVAEEAGYPDSFYFSNRFRRFAGKSPLQFRRDSLLSGVPK